jgi:enoyl-CoA hydratase/carnithine racemase
MSHAFQLSIGSDGIGKLVFNLPGEKINKLSIPALEELDQQLNNIAAQPNIKALVITSGKEDGFIAGADLHAFAKLFESNPDTGCF